MDLNMSIGDLVALGVALVTVTMNWVSLSNQLRDLTKFVKNSISSMNLYFELQFTKLDKRMSKIESIVQRHSEQLKTDTTDIDRQYKDEIDEAVMKYRIKKKELDCAK